MTDNNPGQTNIKWNNCREIFICVCRGASTFVLDGVPVHLCWTGC